MREHFLCLSTKRSEISNAVGDSEQNKLKPATEYLLQKLRSALDSTYREMVADAKVVCHYFFLESGNLF